MTYLDLLNRIKDGTHSKYVMFNGDLYKWTGKNYSLNYNNDDYLADILDETDMVSKKLHLGSYSHER